MELTGAVDWAGLVAEFQSRYGAELDRLRQELQGFGADATVLDIANWQFSADALEPGGYTVTVDGTIGLTDPTRPASEVHFPEIRVGLRQISPSE
ncbi:MAG: hypothetical protein ACE5KR_03200 [Candidatus Bipolaricaulia bacterium]